MAKRYENSNHYAGLELRGKKAEFTSLGQGYEGMKTGRGTYSMTNISSGERLNMSVQKVRGGVIVDGVPMIKTK